MKKFKIGDNTDSLLTTAIAHEYSRAKESFDQFTLNESLRGKNPNSKKVKIRSYNLYTDFVSHLYEFYIACIKRDRNSLADIDWKDADKLLVFEAQKMMNLAAEGITVGKSPSWENHISSYKVTVPDDFGKHFRFIRNRWSHVDPKRTSGSEITLTEFFKKYHFYIYKLYEYPAWLWQITDIEKQDFKDIENFCISVSSHNKQNQKT